MLRHNRRVLPFLVFLESAYRKRKSGCGEYCAEDSYQYRIFI